MLSSISKWQSHVDTANVSDGDSLAAYLTSAAGDLLTSTTVGATERLDAIDASSHLDGSAYAAGTDYLMSAGAVDSNGDWKPLELDASGNLKVAGTISVDFSYDYAEDSASASGDIGAFVLAVRQDTLASSTSADGDYAAFKVNAAGELYVHDTDVKAQLVTANGYLGTMDTSLNNIEASVAAIDTDLDTVISSLSSIDTSLNNIETSTGNIDTNVAAINGYFFAEDAAHASGDKGIQALAVRRDTTGSNASASGDYASLQVWSNGDLKVVDHANLSTLSTQVTVGTSAVALPVSALAGRKSLLIQNNSSATIYIGGSGVTTSGSTMGIKVPKGGALELDAGPANTVYAIAGSAGNNIVVLEMA